MSRFRLQMLLSGLAGLLAGGLLIAAAIWLAGSERFIAPLPLQVVTLVLVLIFGGFSLIEIPMMVFALRRLAAERRGNYGVVLGINVLYVSFAAVYGIPVLLLTGNVGWGLALCALSLVRFVTSLIFVREAQP